MTRVFADTSFYVAVVNPRDALHAAAAELAGTFRGSILTTEYVAKTKFDRCLDSRPSFRAGRLSGPAETDHLD